MKTKFKTATMKDGSPIACKLGDEYVHKSPAPVSPVCKSEDKATAKPTALESVLRLCRTQVVNQALADKAKAEHAALDKLRQHILAMADDAYLLGHPEWTEIVKEAKG